IWARRFLNPQLRAPTPLRAGRAGVRPSGTPVPPPPGKHMSRGLRSFQVPRSDCRSALDQRRRGLFRLARALALSIGLATLAVSGGSATAHAGDGVVVQVLFPDLQARDQFLSEYPETEVRTERRI